MPKFLDARKFCFIQLKVQTKRPKHNDANGIPNSVDPDQTAPLVCPDLSVHYGNHGFLQSRS